jgi:hypothetical protein
MRLRSLSWSGKVGLALVAIVVVGGASWGAWLLTRNPGQDWASPALASAGPAQVIADGETPTPAPTQPRGNATHPAAAALRNRMLEHFHGKATNVFTNIPGFGMDRMVPVYERIPFEIPSFSPGEADSLAGKAQPPAPLLDVFGQSLAAFKDPSRPLEGKKPERVRPWGLDPEATGYGTFQGNAIAHGLQLRMLDLIGLLDKESPKAYSGGRAFDLVRMARPGQVPQGPELNPVPREKPKPSPAPETKPDLETRSLDLFEIAGVEELQKGQEVYIRHKDNIIRMLGALRASDDCLKCHTEAKKGDLLGAFSYTFYSKQDLFKSKKPTEAPKPTEGPKAPE